MNIPKPDVAVLEAFDAELAAISVEVEEEAESVPMDSFQMDVDRPFVFFIHDEEIHEMLFNGAVFNPDV